MTLENFQYRTDPLFLRDQFHKHSGKYGIPIIPKAYFSADELRQLRLLRFDQVKSDQGAHRNRMVHFFVYDYLFEKVWTKPEKWIEMLRPYRGVLTPDFSMYIEMPEALQLYNTFRNRWCGAYFADHSLPVIPTVSWGEESSFSFCFEGIEKGSIVAVSTYMFHESDHHADQKDLFMAGYQEMLRRIEPEAVICYSEPFPEMEGNIIYVDYELSSWKHMEDDIVPAESIKHTQGILTLQEKRDIITKSGYVCKGGGSAYGGSWKPKKSEDERLKGKPGEIKVTKDGRGNLVETKIGKDGLAVKERHHTTSPNPKYHSDPHDHEITWEEGFPHFGTPINYWDGIVPEFKDYVISTEEVSKAMPDFQFESISEMKQSILWGGEVCFAYQGSEYGILRAKNTIILNCGEMDEWTFENPDALLNYQLNGELLKDVLLKAEITWRNI